jgi:DNA-binding NarL/FixJ family response regulator
MNVASVVSTTAGARTLLVEDDRRIAEVIRAILNGAGLADLDVVHTAALAEARLRSATHGLVLVDLGLPDRDGVELIRSIRAAGFAGSILVLTSATGPERILAAVRAGADGYMFKEDLDTRLGPALRHLTSGGNPFSGAAARVVLDEVRRAAPPLPAGPSPSALTAREREVLALLSTGASYGDIARDLAISVNTVRSYIRSLYEKCGVANRAEAVNRAWNLGLLARGP